MTSTASSLETAGRHARRAAKAAATPRVPGDVAMWTFVICEMLIFGGWFTFYMNARAANPALFLKSQQHLDQLIGAINTFILLTSSWFIALCVEASRENKHSRAIGFAGATIFCGILFIISKVFEYSAKFAHGHVIESNEFFTYYYFLTGVHVFHVTIGFVVLAAMIRELADPTLRSPVVIESSATYWHMVDLLWVIIFALLYLMR